MTRDKEEVGMESNLFIWLSGADTKLLNKCPKGERTKFIGYGTLILIPAFLGLFSMSYAISTVSENPYIYLTGGIIWFLIVLVIDRFLMSNLYKSNLKGGRKQFILSLIARYVLAIVIGVAVAHPITMLFFEGSINQQLQNGLTSDIIGEENVSLEILRKDLTKNIELSGLKEKKKDCYATLITAEEDGIIKQLECGSSTGRGGGGSRLKFFNNQFEGLKIELEQINKSIISNKEKIDKIEQTTKKNVEDNYSFDYLAKVTALHEIEEKNTPHVTIVKIFMMIFFVLIDIIPVTIKAIIPLGKYELFRDTQHIKIEKNNITEQNSIRFHHDQTLTRKIKLEEYGKQEINEIDILTEVMKDMIKLQDEKRKDIDDISISILKDIAKSDEPEIQKLYSEYFGKISQMYTSMITQNTKKITERIINKSEDKKTRT
jgi:hypothetical protein